MKLVNIEDGLNKPNSEHTQKVLLQVRILSHLTNIIVGIQKWCKSLQKKMQLLDRRFELTTRLWI